MAGNLSLWLGCALLLGATPALGEDADRPPANYQAIARADHDFAFDDKDTSSPRVTIPDAVRQEIDREAQRLHAENLEEGRIFQWGKQKVAELYGPTFFVPAPGGMSLYVVVLGRLEHGRREGIAIIYDPRIGKCTTRSKARILDYSIAPAGIVEPGEFAKRPYVQFEDLDGDGAPELVLEQYRHNGTWSARSYVYFAVGKDLSLTPMLRYEAAFPYYSDSEDFHYVREIKKIGPGVIRISTHPEHPTTKSAAPRWTITLRSPRPGAPFSFESKKDYDRCHD